VDESSGRRTALAESAPPRAGDLEGSRAGLARAAAVLAVATVVANAAGYLLAVAGSHRLTTSDYGLLGSLLAVLAIGSVPGLAVQAVTARRIVVTGADQRHVIGQGIVVGAACAAVGLAALPGLRIFLHARSATAGIAATVVTAVPWTVLCAVQGWLQGQERFRALAGVVLAAGAARLVGGVGLIAVGTDAATAMCGIAVATGVAAVLAVWWLSRRGADPGALSRTSRRPGWPWREVGWRELALAAGGLGGLLVISNLDLLLARHVLPTGPSGRYAAAAVVARVAFWLPQAIALTVLPRLSDPARRGTVLRDAVLATIGVGVVGVLVTATVGGWLMALTFGTSYRSVGGIAWVFALQGSVLALAQLLVVDGIARNRHGLVPILCAVGVVEAALILVISPATVDDVALLAVSCAALLLLAMVVSRRAGQAAPSPR
jgi:O-antigen/teichoic acid export membrane protein